jgi:hypothetical protein
MNERMPTGRGQYLAMSVRSTTCLVLVALGAAAIVQPARAQQPPCANEFLPLRQAVERDGAAVKKLADRKAPREQVCEQIKKFAVTEAKYLKFLSDNQTWCGIPAQAVQQVKAGHAHTLKLRTQVCAVGGAVQGRAGPPPGPGLSEALGTAQSFTPPSPKTARGTYDTLTGNPFQR